VQGYLHFEEGTANQRQFARISKNPFGATRSSPALVRIFSILMPSLAHFSSLAFQISSLNLRPLAKFAVNVP
jgi:hypothetical protein